MKTIFLTVISLFSFLILPVSAQNVLSVRKVGIDTCTTTNSDYGKLIFDSYISNLEFESETGNILEQNVTHEINPLGDEKFTYNIILKAASSQNIIIKDQNSPQFTLTVETLERGTCQSFYIDYTLQNPVTSTTKGALSIKTNPTGASITIIGEAPLNKITPFVINDHPTGTFRIRLEKTDYSTLDTTITIIADKVTELKTKLKPRYTPSAPTNEMIIMQNEIKRHGRNQVLWLVSTILTAGTGGYFIYEANQKYEEYLGSTDSGAAYLHETVDLYDKLGPAFLGLAGLCAVEYTIQTFKKSKDKKQLKLYISGQGAKLTFNF